MQDSIFTKIINGEIPCHKVYEDEQTFAFMDIHPAAEGHVLVVPKKQVEFVWDLPDEDYQAVMATVKKIALKQREVFNKPYIGEMIVGTDVPHAHVHVVPFHEAHELKNALTPVESEPNHDELAAVAAKLAL